MNTCMCPIPHTLYHTSYITTIYHTFSEHLSIFHEELTLQDFSSWMQMKPINVNKGETNAETFRNSIGGNRKWRILSIYGFGLF